MSVSQHAQGDTHQTGADARTGEANRKDEGELIVLVRRDQLTEIGTDGQYVAISADKFARLRTVLPGGHRGLQDESTAAVVDHGVARKLGDLEALLSLILAELQRRNI